MNDKLTTSQRGSRANRGFFPIIIGSLFLHSAAVAGVLYTQHRRPAVADIRNSIPVQLVALGKKRAPELLPRKVEEPAAQPETTQGVALETSEEAPKEPKEKTEKKKTDLSAAAKKLLEGSDSKLERALDKLDDREGDPDGDVRGTTTDRANAAAGYQRQIIKSLQSAYRLPETIPSSQRQFLKAAVLLYIEKNGSISKYEFTETHPNDMFMSALESLLKSIKLPPPPASEAATLKETGIIVIFRP